MFRVWPDATGTNAPLLACGQTVTNGAGGVSFLAGPDTGLHVEAVSNGVATLTYAFAGDGEAWGLTCSAALKMTAWSVEFVHAEGDEIGQPMGGLPIFTPCSGAGKGMPIYDFPGPDLTVAFAAAPNTNGLRSAALTYLGTQYAVIETAPGSLLFTNDAVSVLFSDTLLADTNVVEAVTATVTLPILGITNAAYSCSETDASCLAFTNERYGIVFNAGDPSATGRTAHLRISAESLGGVADLTETGAETCVFTNASMTVRLLASGGQPLLSVSDGYVLSNTVFSVWETAAQSHIYRNYNEAIPTDLDEEDLAVPDFVPWRLKIKGIGDAALISLVSITTSVDSVSQIMFSTSGNDLISAQKYILIPSGELEEDPPGGYLPLRVDTLQSRWWDEEQKDVSVIMTLAMASNPDVSKRAKSQKGALVLESLDLNIVLHGPLGQNISTKGRIADPLKAMKYDTSTANYKATVSYALAHAPGKQVWYSLTHGALEYERPDSDFQGLEFLNGEGLTAGDLTPLNLDYRLVLIDACCGAKTTSDNIEGARNNNTLTQEVEDFADAFGDHSAYVGWAWTMNPSVSQPLMSEFLDQLKYRSAGKFTPSVAYAYEAFRYKKISEDKYPSPEEKTKVVNTVRLLKIYGYEALQNKIDLTEENTK